MKGEPWWAPIRDALAKKAAELIENIEFTAPKKKPLIIDVQAIDRELPPKKA